MCKLSQQRPRTDLIYKFYEDVTSTSAFPLDKGDRVFRCRHPSRDGSHRSIKITARSNGNIKRTSLLAFKTAKNHSNIGEHLLGLKTHLSDISPALYKLYNVMQARSRAPDTVELEIAEGHLPITHPTAEAYLEKIARGQAGIDNNFEKVNGGALALSRSSLCTLRTRGVPNA
jgi:hypothetical protein